MNDENVKSEITSLIITKFLETLNETKGAVEWTSRSLCDFL